MSATTFSRRVKLGVTAAAFILAISGCVQPEPEKPGTPIKLTSADINLVKSGITKSLKDPESAKFGPLGASQRSDGLIYVCGYVNAKNSYGGYTGSQKYFGLYSRELKSFTPIEYASNDATTYAVNTQCSRYGVPI